MSTLTDHIAEEFLTYTKKLYNNDQGIHIVYADMNNIPGLDNYLEYIYITDEGFSVIMIVQREDFKELETSAIDFKPYSKVAFSVKPLNVGDQVLQQI